MENSTISINKALLRSKEMADDLVKIGEKLNLSESHITEFLQTFLSMNAAKKPATDSDDCAEYCGGTIRNVMLSYKALHGYFAMLICIFGTIANVLNIIVLTQKEMNKTPINSILKWLSVTDMFVMIEYIPFASYMYLIFPDKLGFEYSWAVYLLFHMHFTQILHTISILLTVTLALWRYVAIKHPHSTLASYAQSHYHQAILLSFGLSPLLCFPTYFVFHIKQTHIWEQMTSVVLYHLSADEETMLYRFNFWVHSVIIKLLPCCVLTVISVILIQVLWQTQKRKIKLKSYSNTNPSDNGARPIKQQRHTDRTTTLLVAVLLLFLCTEFPQGILGLLSAVRKKCFFKRCYSIFGEVMDLLALINAAIVFVLYGLMSKQFRTTFKAIFCTKQATDTNIALETTRVDTGVTTACV